jgi:hypothetical protein
MIFFSDQGCNQWYTRYIYFQCGRKRYIQMMVDGISPSLRGNVDDIVASGGNPTRGQGSRHVQIFVETKLSIHFIKIILEMRLGPHGKVDGVFGLVLRYHTHKED